MFRLAQDHGIVLLNGGGFAAPDWSVRTIAHGYRQAHEADKGKNGKARGKKAPKAKG